MLFSEFNKEDLEKLFKEIKETKALNDFKLLDKFLLKENKILDLTKEIDEDFYQYVKTELIKRKLLSEENLKEELETLEEKYHIELKKLKKKWL